MPTLFTDVGAMLCDLLDRFETGVASPLAYPDHARFSSIVAADGFLRDVRKAEATGAVGIKFGTGAKRGELSHIRLLDAALLYTYLDRVPVSHLAKEASAKLVDGLSLAPELTAAASQVADAWSRAKTWNSFAATDVERLRGAFMLAQAILEDRHIGVDYRTFSRRIAEDSKALERVESAVVRLVGLVFDLPPQARPREALRALGLERFAPPLLVAGPLHWDETDVSAMGLAYVGMPANEAHRIRFHRRPTHVLTIENFASFNRHVLEADIERSGVTIYVGGYPSLGTQDALRRIGTSLPEGVPLFHWSDIDIDGAWIFQTVERALGRPLMPHLMSVEIAERHGKATQAKKSLARRSADSAISGLVDYLQSDAAKTVEQEELDPCLPNVES